MNMFVSNQDCDSLVANDRNAALTNTQYVSCPEQTCLYVLKIEHYDD